MNGNGLFWCKFCIIIQVLISLYVDVIILLTCELIKSINYSFFYFFI